MLVNGLLGAFGGLLAAVAAYLTVRYLTHPELFGGCGGVEDRLEGLERGFNSVADEFEALQERQASRFQLLRQEWDDYYDRLKAKEARIDAKKQRLRAAEDDDEDIPPWERAGVGVAPEGPENGGRELSTKDRLWQLRHRMRGGS